MKSVQSFVDGILPHGLAGDISFLLIFVVVCIALGVYFGRTQLLGILIYGYVSAALLHVFPVEWMSFSPYGRAIIFLALVIFLVLVGDYLFDIHISNAGSDFFWRVMIMSFLTGGMLLSILLTLVPKTEALRYISATVYGYFALPLAQVLWMTVPLLFLLFINKRLR